MVSVGNFSREIEKGFIYAEWFHEWSMAEKDCPDLLADFTVLGHIGPDENSVWTAPVGSHYGHGGMDAKATRLIGASSYHAAAGPSFRIGTNDHWTSLVRGVVALLNGCVKRIHVYVKNGSRHFRSSVQFNDPARVEAR